MKLKPETAKHFWDKVKKTDTCWLWTGALNSKGYGAFGLNGRSVSAHRLSYRMHYGDIPRGMYVCHHCDVRNCVNPDHLFLGTARDNVLDAIAKGRFQVPRNIPPEKIRGEKHGLSKLTRKAVKTIRQLHRLGTSDSQLAKGFGVARGTIYDVTRYRTWRHVPD